MARKNGDERSGQERRAAPRANPRTIKRDDDTTQLLERGEGAIAEEQGRRQTNSGPRGRRKSDESLRLEIREILTADPELEAVDIEVEVEGGAVTLRGAVVDPDARLLAEELVESLAGVQEVHNRLRVEREED
jgi:osmotically-inducible protein OsmY